LQQNPSPPAADSQQLQEQPQQQQIAQAPTASAERRFSIKLQQSTASFERSSSPERPSEAVVEQPRQTAPHQTQFSRSNSRDLVPEMKSTVTRGVSMPNLQAAEKSSIAGAVSLVNPLERDVSLSLSASKLNTRMPDSLPNIVPPAPTAAPRSQSTQRMAGGGASVNSLRPSPSTNSISQSNVSISTASTKSDCEEIDEDSTVNNLNESLKKVKTLVEQEQKEMEQAAEHGVTAIED
jgi:hypothetical protein